MITRKNRYKAYKSKSLLNNIGLQIEYGEPMVLLGSSGCGKWPG